MTFRSFQNFTASFSRCCTGTGGDVGEQVRGMIGEDVGGLLDMARVEQDPNANSDAVTLEFVEWLMLIRYKNELDDWKFAKKTKKEVLRKLEDKAKKYSGIGRWEGVDMKVAFQLIVDQKLQESQCSQCHQWKK